MEEQQTNHHPSSHATAKQANKNVIVLLIELLEKSNYLLCYCVSLCFITALRTQTLCWICLRVITGRDLLLLLRNIWTLSPCVPTPPVLCVICCLIFTPAKSIWRPIKQKPVNISEHN